MNSLSCVTSGRQRATSLPGARAAALLTLLMLACGGSTPGAPGQPTVDQAASAFTANGGPLLADGVAEALLTFVARDSGGKGVAGALIQLSVSGGATLRAVAGKTDATGTFVTQLTSTSAGDKVVQLSAGPAAFTVHVQFVAGPPESGHSSLIVTPASVVADGTSQAKVALVLRDAQGNPIGASPVSFRSNAANARIDPASGVTAGDGTLATTVTSVAAGSVDLFAVAGSTTVQASFEFVAGPADPASSKVVADKSYAAAGGTDAIQLTFTFADSHQNPLSSATANLLGGDAQIAPAGPTPLDGSGSVGVRVTALTPGRKTISAVVGQYTAAIDVVFYGPPEPRLSSFMAGALHAVADGSSAVTLSLFAADANGAPLVGAPAQVRVSEGTLSPPGPWTLDFTGALTLQLTSSKAGPTIASASVAGYFASVTVQFVAGEPSAATSTLTTDVTTLPADGLSAANLTLVARDAQGNRTGGVPVTFSSSLPSSQLLVVSGVTAADGTLASSISANGGGRAGISATFVNQQHVDTAVTFQGVPSQAASMLVQGAVSALADGVDVIALQLVLRDSLNEAVSGVPVSFSAEGGPSFSPASGVTDGNGNVFVNVTSEAAGRFTAVATAGPAVLTAPLEFRAIPSLADSSLSASLAIIPADGSVGSVITATIRDGSGKAISDAPIAFFHGCSGPAPLTGVTGPDGAATETYFARAAGDAIVCAEVGLAGGKTGQLRTSVRGAQLQLALSAAPALIPSDGATPGTLSAHLTDDQGTAVPGIAISFGQTSGPPVAIGVLIGGSVATDASGVASAQIWASQPGTALLFAAGGGQRASAQATFRDDIPSRANSTFYPYTAPVADGFTPWTLELHLVDARGKPVAGQEVQVSASGSDSRLGVLETTTNSQGLWHLNLATTVAETKVVTATFGGFSLQTQDSFPPWPWLAADTGLTADQLGMVAVSPLTGELFLNLGGRIYGSVDSGNSWVPKYFFAPAASMAFDAVDPFTLLFNSAAGSGATTDGGWNYLIDQRSNGVPGTAGVAADPTHTGVFYRCSTSPVAGLFRTADSGQSWTQVPVAADGIEGVVIDPSRATTLYTFTGAGVIWRSLDSGATWSTIPSPGDLNQLAIDSGDSLTFYATVPAQGLYVSRDGGQSWLAGPLPLNSPGTYLGALAVDPTTPGRLLITGGFVVSQPQLPTMFSVDSARTFAPSMGAGPATGGLATFDPLHPGVVYAAFPQALPGLYRSSDGGESFQRLAGRGLVPAGVRVIDAMPATPELVWSVGDELAHSSAGGAWIVPAAKGMSVNGSNVNRVLPDPASQTGFFFVSPGLVSYSSDMGENVVDISTSQVNFFLRDALLLPGTSTLVAWDGASARATSDHGKTWLPFASGVPVAGLAAASDGSALYARTAADVRVSVDGGATFQSAGLLPEPRGDWTRFEVDVGAPTTLFALNNATCTLWISRDAAATWSAPFGLNGSGTCVSAFAQAPGNPALKYVSSFSGIGMSLDHGATWSPIPFHYQALALGVAENGALYAATRSGIFRSASGGM